MFAQPFIQNALLAGTTIAIASGLVGYFVVLRGQVFAGDALSHVAFTGAIAAALLGVDLRLGLFAATVLFAVIFAGLGRRAAADDVTIGTTFAWVLGLGVFFLALIATGAGGGNGILASRELFGSIFSLSTGEAQLAALIALAITGAVLVIARPLLFASIDPQAARSQGVPVRLLGFLFLALLGLDAGEATQAVGALLLLGLIAAPAGAASRLTANPYRGLALAALIALASMWGGIALSYQIPSLPPSSAIIAIATAIYALAFLWTSPAWHRRQHVAQAAKPLPARELD